MFVVTIGYMKELKCKYCETTENLKSGMRLGKVFYYPVCESCFSKYRKDKISKRKATTLKKYGVENVFQSTEIKNKAKNTSLKKYGVPNPRQSAEVKLKIQKTNEKRYGASVPAKNKDVLAKMKNTSKERYGFDNPIQNKEIRAKAVKTSIARYGVDNIFKSEDFKETMRLANQEKYGCDFFTQTDEMKNKSKKTMIKNYGVEYHSQHPEIKKKMWRTYRENYWETFNIVLKNKYIEPLFTKEYYVEQPSKKEYQYKCLRCTKIFDYDSLNPHRVVCGCSAHRSYFEDDIIAWLGSIGVKNIVPNKKYYEDGKLKYEIDIFLEDYTFGIDFNGIYWHCDKYRDKNYHQQKYLYFKEKNIQLIQIFENEWVNKQEIVKSIIKNKLGMSGKLYARLCELREVAPKQFTEFLEENHLQGAVPAKVKLGLFYQDQLVCVGGFGRYRYKKDNSYEIIRYACRKNYVVVGGLDRIVKNFIRMFNPDSIVSFIDVRYFSGKSYSKFKIEGLTSPNYFYFKEKDTTLTLHSRLKFQKHKLSKKLSKFNPALSEYRNMCSNGYLRIFDAGNIKVVLTQKP